MKPVSDEEKEAYREGANALKGGHRRQFMARVVNAMGHGGQRWAHRELGWDRITIRKGQRELAAGVPPKPNPGGPGRPRTEVALPRLLEDLKGLADAQSQTDPTFRTTRLYTRLSARAARQALIDHFDYTDAELPTEEVIRRRLNELGYHLRAVRKSQPKKSSQKQTRSSSN